LKIPLYLPFIKGENDIGTRRNLYSGAGDGIRTHDVLLEVCEESQHYLQNTLKVEFIRDIMH
jgi:hypothetical protein